MSCFVRAAVCLLRPPLCVPRPRRGGNFHVSVDSEMPISGSRASPSLISFEMSHLQCPRGVLGHCGKVRRLPRHPSQARTLPPPELLSIHGCVHHKERSTQSPNMFSVCGKTDAQGVRARCLLLPPLALSSRLLRSDAFGVLRAARRATICPSRGLQTAPPGTSCSATRPCSRRSSSWYAPRLSCMASWMAFVTRSWNCDPCFASSARTWSRRRTAACPRLFSKKAEACRSGGRDVFLMR